MSTFQKLRQDERETRKGLIVDAAMELFSHRSFQKIGMRDIAVKAGISAAAIYRYFPSRDDILVEALIRHINIFEARLEKQFQEGDPSLEALAVDATQFLVDNEALFQMMGHFMISGQINARTLERYNTVQRYFLNMLDEVTRRAGLKANNRLISHALYASIVGVVMTFRNYPGRSREEIRKHVERLARLISTVFMAGFKAKKDGQRATLDDQLALLLEEEPRLTRIEARPKP